MKVIWAHSHTSHGRCHITIWSVLLVPYLHFVPVIPKYFFFIIKVIGYKMEMLCMYEILLQLFLIVTLCFLVFYWNGVTGKVRHLIRKQK